MKNEMINDGLVNLLERVGYIRNGRTEDGRLKFQKCPFANDHSGKKGSKAFFKPIDESGTGPGATGSGSAPQFMCGDKSCTERNIENLLDEISKNHDLPLKYIQYAGIDTLKVLAETIIAKSEKDEGVCYKSESLECFRVLKEKFPVDWYRIRAKLKTTKSISITKLEKEINKNASAENTGNQHSIALKVIEKIGGDKIIFANDELYVWNETGVWKVAHDKKLKQKIHKVIKTQFIGVPISGAMVNGVLDLIKTETYRSNQQFNSDRNTINCRNGELNYTDSSWVLSPHKPENNSTVQIPCVYDEDSEAPLFKRFLLEVFEPDEEPKEKAKLVLELMGYTLMTNCMFEKFILLKGIGANGKSVLLYVLMALIGSENCSAVQPSHFGNKFQRAHMEGKLVNIVSELKEGAKIDEDVLKSITSGELTTVEKKHGAPFEIHPFSTCWFGTNHFPHLRDFSDGIFRRAIVILFNRVFQENEQDTNLKNKLLEELPGIFKLAVKYYGKVLKRGHFTKVDEVEKANSDLRMESDQVTQFVDDRCRLKPKHSEFSKDVYEAYTAWTRDCGVHKKLNQNNLTARLLQKGVEKGRGSGGSRMLKGIRLRAME